MRVLVTRSLVATVVILLLLAIICHVVLVTILVDRGNYTYKANESIESQALKWSEGVIELSHKTISNIEHENISTVTVTEYNPTELEETLSTLEVTEDQLVEEKINKGVVVTNGPGCSDIGISILEKGGSAVEAAIATLFCEGVSMPQSMGLGGGFLMTIYNRASGTMEYLNAREKAPKFSTKYMFRGDSKRAQKGGLSVAVPGELVGYWAAYEKYGGNIAWKELVQPTIDLCKNGINVTEFLGKLFWSQQEQIKQDPILSEIFIDPSTGSPYLEGQYVRRPRLAKTLEIIAEEGGLAMHRGSLRDEFIRDVRFAGSIITEWDLESYQPEWNEAVAVNLPDNHTLYTVDLPGSGAVLALILNIITNLGKDISDIDDILTNHLIIESFKNAYGKRTKLGDIKFHPEVKQVRDHMISNGFAKNLADEIVYTTTCEDPLCYGASTTGPTDYGTANIVVIAPNGDAVTVTSTINLLFGAGIAAHSTGIILNDEMDDFSSPHIINDFNLPPSPTNFIAPGKQPLSSMTPSIIVDGNQEVIMAVGAAGGTKITTAVAQTVLNHLWFGMDIENAVDHRRFHHQLFPMRIDFENGFNTTDAKPLVNGLVQLGHTIHINDVENGFAAVTAASRDPKSGKIVGTFDKRRSGSVSYIK